MLFMRFLDFQSRETITDQWKRVEWSLISLNCCFRDFTRMKDNIFLYYTKLKRRFGLNFIFFSVEGTVRRLDSFSRTVVFMKLPLGSSSRSNDTESCAFGFLFLSFCRKKHKDLVRTIGAWSGSLFSSFLFLFLHRGMEHGAAYGGCWRLLGLGLQWVSLITNPR